MNKVKKATPAKKTAASTSSKVTKNPPLAKTLHTGPKEVFLQLMTMAMLYIGVISLIMLCFAYVDLKLPDALNQYTRYQALNNIRIASSMLVVSFPLLLFFSWLNQRDLRKTPQKHELKFAKWLVYITLFISSITLIIDLIVLVEQFYSGDLTLPFALKVLSILILAGSVLGYYLWELQNKSSSSKIPAAMAWLSSIVVLGMLVLGFLLAGSPAEQRKIRMDQQRVNDLSRIQSELVNYWQLKQDLPETLDVLNNDLSGFSVPEDPETLEEYTYKRSSELSFELCAVFTQTSEASLDQYGNTYYDPYSGTPQNWEHKAGESCFERNIDPELYPKPVFNQL